MQALSFSHMYKQGASAQFGTTCSHTESATRWFLCRRGILGPRLSDFPPGHMYMHYNVEIYKPFGVFKKTTVMSRTAGY